MGMKYGNGRYFGTRGSIVQTFFTAATKLQAESLIPLLPLPVQSSVRRFISKSSNAFENFSVSEDTAGHCVVIMEKPGDVPGSRAIYIKVVDSSGKTIKVIKETYDPQGNLVHSKTKKEEE
jgi:hypothetical protein